MNDAVALEVALQDCLEMVFQGGKTIEQALARYPHLRQELAPLLESAVWIRSQRAAFSLSPQRQAALRAQVLDSIPTVRHSSGQPTARPPRVAGLRRPVWIWSALIVVLICGLVFASSGVAMAAQNSLPGDRLYAVKAAVEETAVLLSWDASQRVQLRLHYAERRIEEVALLSQQGRYADIGMALNNYEVQLYLAVQEAQRAARADPLRAYRLKTEIEARLQTQTTNLAALENLLPTEQAQAVRQAQNASLQSLQAVTSILTESEATLTPTATLAALASATPAGGQMPLPGLFTPTESSVPPGFLRQTQSPTLRPSLTPRPTNTHRPTQGLQPSKTPKPTQVKPPTKTPKPPNPNKPTSQPQPPGQSKPTKTPKK
ncbi:MAG: hypothetical protein DDG59_06180 [Anaerolineae bacterium]|nr:MAG: hypothetical protein DDG59_06180 [Anaerolineae bacterium]